MDREGWAEVAAPVSGPVGPPGGPSGGAPRGAGGPSPDFLKMDGAPSRPFDLAELENELRAMWRSTSGAGEPHTGSAYRAAMSNLVVPVDPERHARLAPVLIEVTRRHPSRLLLVEIGPHGSPELHAEVAALCHLRPAGGYICSEQIILRGDAEAGPLVPSAVSALLVGNLPTVLLDLHGGAPAPWTADIADRADLVLGDSSESWTLEDAARLWRTIDADPDDRVRDLAWARLAPWREILAEAFDATHLAGSVRHVREAALDYGSAEHAPAPSCVLLLAGWLASRLEWDPVRRERDGAVLQGPDGPVRLRLTREPDVPEGNLHRIQLRSGSPHPLDIQVTHRPRHRSATIDVSAPSVRALEVPFHYRELAECVVTEVHRHEPNPQLRDAARAALALLPHLEDRAA